MTADANDYRNKYECERKARAEAEQLLEDKTRALFDANQQLEKKIKLLETQQAKLFESEKMATLGTLSAGVAHEINNPLAYVMSNIESLSHVAPALLSLLELAERLRERSIEQSELAAELERINTLQSFSFLREDLPELLEDSMEGLGRIRDIVQSLLSFARSSQREKDWYELSEIMQGTLKLLSGKMHNIELETHFNERSPCYCSSSSIGQVFVNLLINAIQALEDTTAPKIKVAVTGDDRYWQIEIGDNGKGMTPQVVRKMFDPFFTTKPVGVGTGMGMSVVYSIIAEHGGDIDVDSTPGQGTRIVVSLPKDASSAS